MARKNKGNKNKNSQDNYEWTSDVEDDDDEEIPEDEAFNSEDERKYGALFENSSSSSKKKKKSKREDKDSDEESSDDDEMSSSEEEEEDSDNDDDDDTDDDSDDGIASSEDEDEENDGGDYMLQLLNQIDSNETKKDKQAKAQSVKTYTQSLPPESVHAASSVSNSTNRGALTLDGLINSISDTKNFHVVQKDMKSIVPSSSSSTTTNKLETTKTPAARILSARTKRKLHYNETSTDITKWDESIKSNRFAETLDFRNNTQRVDKASKEELIGKFVPCTDFEKEIAQALEKAGGDEGALAQKEKDALLGSANDDDDDLGDNKISVEEYKKRLGLLAKTRALMFYEEQKRHHMNKIKSKKYRKIRKKQRDRIKEAELQSAMEEDPDLKREMEEKEELERLKERMSLAHRNTSKWAKRVLRRGSKVDQDQRRALSAQLHRGDELRRKMDSIYSRKDQNDSSDDDSEEGEEDEMKLISKAKDILKETEEDIQNKQEEEQRGLFQLKFMQRGLAAQRERAKEEARQLLKELEANVPQDSDDEEIEEGKDDYESMEKEDEERKKRKVASEEDTAKVIQKGNLVASSLDFGMADSLVVGGNINVDLNDDDSDNDSESGSDDDGSGEETEKSEDAENKDMGEEKEATEEEKDGDDKHESTAQLKKRKKKKRQKRKRGNDNADTETTENDTKLVNGSSDHTATITLSKSNNTNTSNTTKTNQQKQSANSKDHDDEEDMEEENESKNPWIQQSQPSSSSSKKKRKKAPAGVTKDGIVDVKGAVNSLLTHHNDDAPANKSNQKENDIGGEDEEKKEEQEQPNNKTAAGKRKRKKKKNKSNKNQQGIATLSQDELVRRAFAAPDASEVEEEFAKEKDAIRERDDPTLQKKDEDDNKVSGWGSWAGMGAPPPPPKKSKKTLPKHLQPPEKKKEQGRKRQDDNKKNVIINERRVKKNAKFQLQHIPYPYTSREQYELAMAGGIGPEWNVSGAVKDMTRPEIITRAGKIIQPLSKKAKAKRAPAKF